MSKPITIIFTLNNKHIEATIPANRLLVDMIREDFNLTGTKIGCGMGECGACTILMDGKPVNSCLTLAIQADGKTIETIEGLSEDGKMNPLQEMLVKEGAVQCGFCTPGIVMSATALLRENPHPTEEKIKTAISGNLCRCTGYQKIIEAIKKM